MGISRAPSVYLQTAHGGREKKGSAAQPLQPAVRRACVHARRTHSAGARLAFWLLVARPQAVC